MIKQKRGQGIGTETLIILFIAVVVAVLVIWGFSANWWGLAGKIQTYSGGSSLSEISNLCKISCETGQVNPYCVSELKIANKLEASQLNSIKTKLIGFKCYGKDGNTEIVKTDACTSNEGLWKSGSSAEELNYYTSQAKVTCNSLAKAGLIDPCNAIPC